MKDFITPQQGKHIKERLEKERNNIRTTANKEGRALKGAEKKEIARLNNLIKDAEAVTRGDGRKKGK